MATIGPQGGRTDRRHRRFTLTTGLELAVGNVRELNDARDRTASLAGVARVRTSLILNRDKESDS